MGDKNATSESLERKTSKGLSNRGDLDITENNRKHASGSVENEDSSIMEIIHCKPMNSTQNGQKETGFVVHDKHEEAEIPLHREIPTKLSADQQIGDTEMKDGETALNVEFMKRDEEQIKKEMDEKSASVKVEEVSESLSQIDDQRGGPSSC